jgi:hypothetical protein
LRLVSHVPLLPWERLSAALYQLEYHERQV